MPASLVSLMMILGKCFAGRRSKILTSPTSVHIQIWKNIGKIHFKRFKTLCKGCAGAAC